MSKIAAIIGRILIGVMFIVSGFGKVIDPASTAQMLSSVGLSPTMATAVGVFELVAGIMLAIGLAVRLVSVVLFAFVALTILFFHSRFTDPIQAAQALKNLAIMGGLLLAFAHSQMWSHYYAIESERKGERAAREAEARAHEAELRAARAEGAVAAAGPAPVAGAVHHVPAGHAITPRRRRWFDW